MTRLEAALLMNLKELFELHLDATGKQKRSSKEDIEEYYDHVERSVKAIIKKAEKQI